jgi:hypothetical protein
LIQCFAGNPAIGGWLPRVTAFLEKDGLSVECWEIPDLLPNPNKEEPERHNSKEAGSCVTQNGGWHDYVNEIGIQMYSQDASNTLAGPQKIQSTGFKNYGSP